MNTKLVQTKPYVWFRGSWDNHIYDHKYSIMLLTDTPSIPCRVLTDDECDACPILKSHPWGGLSLTLPDLAVRLRLVRYTL